MPKINIIPLLKAHGYEEMIMFFIDKIRVDTQSSPKMKCHFKYATLITFRVVYEIWNTVKLLLANLNTLKGMSSV